MKKLLIIGSIHTDIEAETEALPRGNEEMRILSTAQKAAGFSYACASVMEKLHFPYELPVSFGNGVYGEFAYAEAEAKGIKSIPLFEGTAGCTYHLKDREGHTAFFAAPGSEYDFDRSLIEDTDGSEIAAVLLSGEMLCGLGAGEVLEVLYDLDVPVYFVPGEMALQIPQYIMEALLSVHPVLCLEDSEAYDLFGKKKEVFRDIYEETGNTVILYHRGEGLYLYDGKETILASAKEELDRTTAVTLYLCARNASADTRNALMFAARFSTEEALRDTEDSAEALRKGLAGILR